MRFAPVVSALTLAAALVVAVASAAAAPERHAAPVRATLVGDSVAASIEYTLGARAELRRGLAVTLDLAVCRRLVQPGCRFQGRAPTTALQAVKAQGRDLGRILVVDVGYNESADGYAEGIDRVMRAALTQGAVGVVWVTLRETRPLYAATNRTIRAAARRWPQLVVADWNAHSAGRRWFRPDGLHLTETGATALAEFVRHHVVRAAAA